MAVGAGKVAAGLSRRLGRGGGTALPGLVAERIDARIVSEMASRLGGGSVLVTGTNGKTTTALLLRSIVRAEGWMPVANRAGSNMMRGVAAAFVEAATWSGEVDACERRIGIFEVDEATMPQVAGEVRPRAVVFTNLFRDQLDRYGEVEYVASVWRAAVAGFPESVTLVLNADDPSVSVLGAVAKGPVIYYGLDDLARTSSHVEHAADARWCAACGSELAYAAVFYGHIGHWSCPGCGASRPLPQVAGRRAAASADGMEMGIALPAGGIDVRLPLGGVYNAYNALAAAAAATVLGVPVEQIAEGLGAATAAFGRQEKLRVRGREIHVVLAKNPAGLNQVVRTITADGEQKDMAFFLNDGIADGRDISWIWDVDFELLAGHVRTLTVSGTRAWDMALRLKYAGFDPLSGVEQHTEVALRGAIDRTPEGGTLFVVPTYTAMLQVRGLLARWAGRGAFWEGE